MALEKQLTEESENEPQGDVLSEEDEASLEICVLLGKALIDDGGKEVLEAAKTSKDPGQVIGQFLVQLGSQMAENLPEELKPNPAIMLAEGGWVEQMSDFLQEEYGVSREDADRAEIYVGTTAQQIAQTQQQPGGPAGPAPAAAPAGPVMPGAA